MVKLSELEFPNIFTHEFICKEIPFDLRDSCEITIGSFH
nr:MAG TPA: hypothetical protein [Caudoviricetes sp.]DAX32271.1 MAG TPA: hypothetical protein [Caudoviricetes sp.]